MGEDVSRGVAAARAGRAGAGQVVCVISGGNLGLEELATLIERRGRPA